MSTPPARKKLSGAGFRMKRKLQEKEAEKMAGSLSKFLKSESQKRAESEPGSETSEPLEEQPSTSGVCEMSFEVECSTDTDEESCPKPPSPSILSTEQRTVAFDFSDPADWPEVINTSFRDRILMKGPVKQSAQFSFPRDESRRHFSTNFYQRRLGNGEMHHRDWLIYSAKLNKMFCFCCKLFTTAHISLTASGCNDWKNASQILSAHEVSQSHLTAMGSWTELLTRIGSGRTIDQSYQRLLSTETQHWQNVLRRLVAIVQYLGKQCLAFRGSSDTLYSEGNGNYLQLVEMLATFDTVMQDHLKKIVNSEIQKHYLGKDIQNELIGLISNEIRGRILQLLKDAKYYAIILDCTPDIAHVEQLTVIIRFVSVKQGDSPTTNPEVTIEERFIGFLPVHNTTGEGLTDAILAELQRLKIPLGNMRGQGYDNGSNMKGKHSGVQKRIRELNPRAFFVPCSAHSLNLVVNDAATCCRDASAFFDSVHKTYVFLSGSTNRWDILKKHISKLTVKPLSDTRWSSRIDAIRPFRFQIGELYDTLLEIEQDATFANLARHEASSLANAMSSFKFLCFVVLWFKILNHINSVSKLLQSQSLYLPDALDLLESSKKFLEAYRTDDGFEELIKEAGELAVKMEVDPVFPTLQHQQRKRRRLFSYEGHDDPILDPKIRFKVECFFTVLDVAIKSISERFEQLEFHSTYFQFLYDIRKLKDVPKDQLQSYCMKLQSILTDGKVSDVDGAQLCEELIVLAPVVKSAMTPIDVLAYAVRNGFAPNVAIALRILLTLPITVATGERSFSKLKIIKNYLRSSMSQERLVGLAMISIENRTAQEINFELLLKDFANAKARKVKLL